MNRTKIEYCDFTWNPIVGCTMGCPYCYARRLATTRLAHLCPKCATFTPHLHPERLDQPWKRKKPARIFVCDMGDLFDPTAPFGGIVQVFGTMKRESRHTFLLLTKQPENMKAFCKSYWGNDPLPNVHLGVSVTCQADADERIPLLLKTPAAVRWVSIEPMMGPVELFDVDGEISLAMQRANPDETLWPADVIDWVVLGGMSGPMAAKHPLDPAWVRDVRDQCVAAGVPFFFKQWGEWSPWDFDMWDPGDFPSMEICKPNAREDEIECLFRVGHKLAGRKLDGREWNELPKGPERGEA